MDPPASSLQGHPVDLSEVHMPEHVAERCVKRRRAAATAAAGKRAGKSNGGLMLKLLRFNAKVLLLLPLRRPLPLTLSPADAVRAGDAPRQRSRGHVVAERGGRGGPGGSLPRALSAPLPSVTRRCVPCWS